MGCDVLPVQSRELPCACNWAPVAVAGFCDYNWGAALLRLFESLYFGLIAAVLSELTVFLLLRRLWKESCTTEQACSATVSVLEAEA